MFKLTFAVAAVALAAILPAAAMADHRNLHPENGRTTISESGEGMTITGQSAGGGTPEGASNDAGGGTATVELTPIGDQGTITFSCSGGGSEKGGGGRFSVVDGSFSDSRAGRGEGC